jgi:hypothetical protein
MTYRLSDKTVGQIARLLQIALLTGTDIVDNLRTLRLSVDGDVLEPDEKYLENFEANLNKMVESIADNSTTDETVN